MNFYRCLFPILIFWTLLLGGCAKINAIDAADARSERNERAIEEIQKVIKKIGDENDGRTEFAIRSKKRLLKELAIKRVAGYFQKAAAVRQDMINLDRQVTQNIERHKQIVSEMSYEKARLVAPSEGWAPLESIYSTLMSRPPTPFVNFVKKGGLRDRDELPVPEWSGHGVRDLPSLDPTYEYSYADEKECIEKYIEALGAVFRAACSTINGLEGNTADSEELRKVFDSPQSVPGFNEFFANEHWLNNYWQRGGGVSIGSAEMFIDMEVARKDLEAALDGPGPNWIDEFEKEFRGRFKY
jgi:hypothetical protein